MVRFFKKGVRVRDRQVRKRDKLMGDVVGRVPEKCEVRESGRGGFERDRKRDRW